MVSVVNRRPVLHATAVAHGEIVRNRDRLAMGDQKPMVWPFEWCPTAHPDGRTRPTEIDRGVATELMACAVRWESTLVCSPAELGRLPAFAAKPVDRPGIDEFADPL